MRIGYIFLLQQSTKSNKNIFKINKSVHNHYPKNSKLLFHILCNDCDTFTNTLTQLFINNYTQVEPMTFVGDVNSMYIDIFNIIGPRNSTTNNLYTICSNNIQPNTDTHDDTSGYIYVLQEREFVNSNKNIYKIGKSKQHNLKRFKQYPKGSVLLLQLFCNDCDTFEKYLIQLFIINYKQIRSVGIEYFEGEFKSMYIDIFNHFYQQHTIFKQQNIYKCDSCNTILSSKRNLECHILNVCKFNHSCDKCNKTFKSNNYLLVHKKKCVGIFKCHKCSKILSRKQTYLNHISKCK
mgnify:CR=1 FL=1|tara:strand:+ start:100 stop:978 length:879 start_codon:yes stop_codon:yes gene_type:complete